MSKSDRLTQKQRDLLRDLHSLAELFGLDYTNIQEYEPEARTPFLEVMKRKLVLAQVVTWYTLVDEYLNNEICRYYFGRKRTFPQLWKTKRFRLFNHHVLEDLYPLQKLRLVKAFRSIPKTISRDIDSLNNLRNGLAHAFFPENLRKSKPTWKGKDIYSLDGAKSFNDDMRRLSDFFLGFVPDVDRVEP